MAEANGWEEDFDKRFKTNTTNERVSIQLVEKTGIINGVQNIKVVTPYSMKKFISSVVLEICKKKFKEGFGVAYEQFVVDIHKARLTGFDEAVKIVDANKNMNIDSKLNRKRRELECGAQ